MFGFLAAAQEPEVNYKLINKNVEIVKPIGYFIDESDRGYLLDSDVSFVHIKIISFESAGNIVTYWIESDGERYNYHMVTDVMVIYLYEGDRIGYGVFDEDFRYATIIKLDDETLKWAANFNTSETQNRQE
jgi:hypothetical protein